MSQQQGIALLQIATNVIAKPRMIYSAHASISVGVVINAAILAGAKLAGYTQQFNVGQRIELFVVDATSLTDKNGVAGPLFRFTPMQYGGVVVVWRGEQYPPLACVADGFETNGQTAPATPKLRVSNVGNLMGAAVVEFGDLVGATIYRYRTFLPFLDGQPDADPSAYFPPDVYVVQRKATHNKQYIEWEMSAAIDQENVYIPNRPVLKYTCTQSYRFWNPLLNGGAGAFDYSQATCPFNGSQNGNKYYDQNGNQVTDPSKDLCGRQDTDCALRFALPPFELQTWAFPGVGATNLS